MPKLREIDLSKSVLTHTNYSHAEIKEGVSYLCLYGDSKFNSWKAGTFDKYNDRWTFHLGSHSVDFVPCKKGAGHSTFKEIYEIIP